MRYVSYLTLFFYRKSYYLNINCLPYVIITGMMGLEVVHSKEKLCYINVYLPYQFSDNCDLYIEYLYVNYQLL